MPFDMFMPVLGPSEPPGRTNARSGNVTHDHSNVGAAAVLATARVRFPVCSEPHGLFHITVDSVIGLFSPVSDTLWRFP